MKEAQIGRENCVWSIDGGRVGGSGSTRGLGDGAVGTA